jgi:arginyl-tRNA synthetase
LRPDAFFLLILRKISAMIVPAIIDNTLQAVKAIFGGEPPRQLVQVEKTNREYEGDFTLVVFPLLKYTRSSPQDTAEKIGAYLLEVMPQVEKYEIIKGFLNLSLRASYWLDFFGQNLTKENFGMQEAKGTRPVVVEYSSPNTNKPLHLGHIRNNLLGYSISEILKANGHRVVKVNLVNDRGIHICKSMLAWMKWGQGETPESTGIKGDHLVGKYYVLFDRKHKEEIAELVHRGFTDDDAYQQAPLFKEAKELLKQWENAEEDVLTVWHTMNQWAYDGFDETYRRLGVDFDKINYESRIYLEGKAIVMEGLESGAFYQDDDGSIWVDLGDAGLDKKLLLRSDGTSVYITQDIGTAHRRNEEYDPEQLIYIVGNEQIYHFDVLKQVIKKLGKPWYDKIHHLSYGMVELPHGRMKSREGTVVDADDLMDEMFETARKTTEELGKTDEFTEEERHALYHMLSLGAIKYYILKVDPRKNMLFNPEESIDFNGNTGPFIQYTHARIRSVLRKSEQSPKEWLAQFDPSRVELTGTERDLLKALAEFPQVVSQAADAYSPAVVANYSYDLAKLFNHYYQDTPILKRVDPGVATFRILLSWFTGKVLKSGMNLLGIVVPDKM